MSLFVIIGHDVANSAELRKQTRTEHLARLDKLVNENRLIIAGPTPIEHGQPDMSGSLIIADFDSIEDAQSWANEDPYFKAGVYSHVDIRPFVHVLPKTES